MPGGFVPVHDRGRVLADAAVLIADGGRVLSDLATLRDQGEMFGSVASAWRRASHCPDELHPLVDKIAWCGITSSSAGLGGLVFGALSSDLDRCEVVFGDDSGMVFDSSSRADQVESLQYVRNSFQVLITVPRGSVADSTDQLVKQVRKRAVLRNQPRGSAFRTMVNVDGQLVGLPRDVRGRLESVIAEQTGGRLIARGGSGVEYWVVGRRDLDVMMLCLVVVMK